MMILVFRSLLEPTAVVIQSFSHVWLFATPWTAVHQSSHSFTIAWSLLILMSIELMLLMVLFILAAGPAQKVIRIVIVSEFTLNSHADWAQVCGFTFKIMLLSVFTKGGRMCAVPLFLLLNHKARLDYHPGVLNSRKRINKDLKCHWSLRGSSNKTLFKAVWGYTLLLNAEAITFPLSCFCQLLNFRVMLLKLFSCPLALCL